MWLVVTAGTLQRSIKGQMFYAPCLGTDLYQRGPKKEKMASEDLRKQEV